MCLLGLRKQVVCPECGSLDYGLNSVFDRVDIEFSDGHVIRGNLDFSDSEYWCNDCDYRD